VQGDEPIDDDEEILRRFDPTQTSHVARDEGTGTPRLRSGAFYLRADEEGFSVLRLRVLRANSIGLHLAQSPPYVGLAQAEVAAIQACDPTWVVQPDPWPSGEEDGRPVEVESTVVVCEAVIT
jgi:hypothetical protein